MRNLGLIPRIRVTRRTAIWTGVAVIGLVCALSVYALVATRDEPRPLSAAQRYEARMVDLCRRPGPVVARDQLTLLGHRRDRLEAELVVRKGPAGYRCVGIVRTGRPIDGTTRVWILSSWDHGQRVFDRKRFTGELFAVPTDRCTEVNGIVDTRPNVAFAVNEYGSSELLGC